MDRGPVEVVGVLREPVDSGLADLGAELALYVRVPPDDVEAAFAANVG